MEAESKINAKIVGCGLINNFAASHLWDDSTYACRGTVSALAPLCEALATHTAFVFNCNAILHLRFLVTRSRQCVAGFDIKLKYFCY